MNRDASSCDRCDRELQVSRYAAGKIRLSAASGRHITDYCHESHDSVLGQGGLGEGLVYNLAGQYSPPAVRPGADKRAIEQSILHDAKVMRLYLNRLLAIIRLWWSTPACTRNHVLCDSLISYMMAHLIFSRMQPTCLAVCVRACVRVYVLPFESLDFEVSAACGAMLHLPAVESLDR